MPEGTWTVDELHDRVAAVLDTAFEGELWVQGEIHDLRRSPNGHVYFSLTGEGARDAPASLNVTLFERQRRSVNHHLRRSGGAVRMSDGVRVRIRGSIDLYRARGQVRLRMTAIDPVFTLGDLAQRRAALLGRLADDDLVAANGRRRLPILVEHVAFVTSLGSAAHADALHEIEAGGTAVHLRVYDTRVQGPTAPDSLVRSLHRAVADGAQLVVIVRGGGARTDLAAFDDEQVARAIALCPVPVWTGLGHEIDRSVADELAHSSFKTPTAAAAAVVELSRQARDDVQERWVSITAAARNALERHERRLTATRSLAGRRLTDAMLEAELAWSSARDRLVHGADRPIDHGRVRLDEAIAALAMVPETLTHRRRHLDSLATTVAAHDPSNVLARGYSVTRDEAGRIVRSRGVDIGSTLVTVVADGSIRSIVDSTGPDGEAVRVAPR
ncbi:MAG: exodeoxyribonuclease VII large subunit [Microthrixaceae bacterium]